MNIITQLPLGAWDVLSFFENAKNYAELAGGAFLMLLGVVGVIWGFYLGITKLMGNQARQQDSWGKVVALIIVGGAIMVGGFNLASTVASGGKDTILDLGGGIITSGLF